MSENHWYVDSSAQIEVFSLARQADHTGREQGWRRPESARLSPMYPGLVTGPLSHVGGVCFWFSPCTEGFSPGCLVFPLHKTTVLYFTFP